MIQLIDTHYQRIDLLLIPVDTTSTVAGRALTMATDGQHPHIAATANPRAMPVWSERSPGILGDRVSPLTDDNAPDHPAHDRASGNPPSDIVGRSSTTAFISSVLNRKFLGQSNPCR